MKKHFQIHIHYKGKHSLGGHSEGYLGFTHSSENGRMDVDSVYSYAKELAKKQTPEIVGNIVLCNVSVIDTWEAK